MDRSPCTLTPRKDCVKTRLSLFAIWCDEVDSIADTAKTGQNATTTNLHKVQCSICAWTSRKQGYCVIICDSCCTPRLCVRDTSHDDDTGDGRTPTQVQICVSASSVFRANLEKWRIPAKWREGLRKEGRSLHRRPIQKSKYKSI